MLESFPADGDTSIPDNSSFFTPIDSGFSPRLLFETSLAIGSCRSDAVAGEYLTSSATFSPSPSDSEPEAELLSDGDRDGDFFSCFSSFLLFFFFFFAACLLCFLDFASPSMSARAVITSFLPSSFSPSWSPTPVAAAILALALVFLRGFCGSVGSTSDSAPDSELLSFSPFLFFFFFLLLCFLCFLIFLCGGSFPSFAIMSSFSGASSSPEGMSTAHSIVLLPLVFSKALLISLPCLSLTQHQVVFGRSSSCV